MVKYAVHVALEPKKLIGDIGRIPEIIVVTQVILEIVVVLNLSRLGIPMTEGKHDKTYFT